MVTSGPGIARPRAVTVGGTLALVGSAVAVAVLIYTTQQLYSSDMTQVLHHMVTDPRFRSLNLTVESARTMVRYTVMVMAVVCVTSLVLAWFVLRRHRSARIALTVLGCLVGLPLLLGGVVGWIGTAYVAACVLLLWTRSARAWFAANVPTAPTNRAWPPPYEDSRTPGDHDR